MEKHPQAELIKLVVDGLAVPQRYISLSKGSGWYDQSLEELVNIGKYAHDDWRAKPAEPEKVYPVTQMLNSDFEAAIERVGYGLFEQARSVADASLRHAIDNGYLFTQEYVTKAVAFKEF